MPEYFGWLQDFLLNYPSLQYAVIFLASGFGGELGLFILSFFAAQKVISWTALLIWSFIGALCVDALWFFIGKTSLIRKMMSHKRLSPTLELVTEALRRISRRSDQTAMILIKFMIGTRILIFLIISNLYPTYRKFLEHNIPAVLAWLAVMMLLGYLSGLGFTLIAKYLNNIYAAIGFVLLSVLTLVALQIYLKNRVIKSEASGPDDML